MELKIDSSQLTGYNIRPDGIYAEVKLREDQRVDFLRALAGVHKPPENLPTVAPVPQSNGEGKTEEFLAETLVVGFNETGAFHKLKGGRFSKWGVMVYPEYLEAVGIDPQIQPGSYSFNKKVRIHIDANNKAKVVSLA